MTPLVLHIKAINPALIDFFCRCQYQAAFILVVVVMPRSLSAPVVIGGSVIVLVYVAMRLDQNRLNDPLKNTSQLGRDVSTMPLDNSVSDRESNKK